MCKLTKNQIEVLELFYKGFNKKEIQKNAELSPSSVDEALRRGKMNVDKAVETIHMAVERGLMSSSQIHQLKQIYRKI